MITGAHMDWIKRLTSVTAVAAMLMAPAAVLAQEESEVPVAPEASDVDAASEDSNIFSGGFGLDIVTAYFFRGYVQEDSGFIAQPWAEAGVNVYTGDEGDALGSVDFTIGYWNSIHSKDTGVGNAGDTKQLDPWYELDLYAGVSATVFDVVGVGLSYVGYFSPNQAFDDIHELDLSLSYDDSELLGDFAMAPELTFAFEVNDTGGTEDHYMQLSFGPSMTIVESEEYPVTLSVPFNFGFSLDDYYVDASGDDNFFGWASVGAHFGVPLAFMGDEFGAWEAGAGVDLLFLGSAAQDANSGDDFEVVGIFSVGASF